VERGTRDRLVWHGVLLFLVGLLMGLVTYSVANPRMGLSAHVGAVINGAFLIALGAAWDTIRLTPRADRFAFWLLTVGSWGGSLGVFVAAVLNTRDATPLHGAAQSAEAWKEGLVGATLVVMGIALLAGVVVALYGLRRRAPA
jgi:hydroxylaminobenzene mutase